MLKKLGLALCILGIYNGSFAQTYLSLTGGTLTGALTGTSSSFNNGTFLNSGAGPALDIQSNWTASSVSNDLANFSRLGNAVKGAIGYNDAATAIYFGTKTDHPVEIRQGDDVAIGIASNLDVTLAGALNGSSAAFTGIVKGSYLQFDNGNLGIRNNSGLITFDAGANYPGGFNFQYGGSSTSAFYINSSGNIGISTTSPTEKLSVNGKILAKEVKVETGWSDFVFEPTYKLRGLKETEEFIKENKHLPEIPSAKEVAENGINVGEINAKLLQKIEELTLHLIEQDKRSDKQDEIIERQQQEINRLKSKP